MKKFRKDNLSNESILKCINSINDSLVELPRLSMSEFDIANSVIVNVDTINGFCKQGNLASSKVENILPYLQKLNNRFESHKKLFLVDWHSVVSEEFNSFPSHSVAGTLESEIVPELRRFESLNATVIHKNSVNGFVSKEFTAWLEQNDNIRNYVVVGDVTDICVMNFALTLKAHFNEHNIKARVVIPILGVETFDLDATNHDGFVMNLFALYNMRMNGIEIVEDIV